MTHSTTAWELATSTARELSARLTGTRWRHKKRGTEYDIAGAAVEESSLDVLMVYRGDDGTLITRPYLKFMDGRFEQITAAPAMMTPAAITDDVVNLAAITFMNTMYHGHGGGPNDRTKAAMKSALNKAVRAMMRNGGGARHYV